VPPLLASGESTASSFPFVCEGVAALADGVDVSDALVLGIEILLTF